MLTVKRMRPTHSWEDVVRVLNARGHNGLRSAFAELFGSSYPSTWRIRRLLKKSPPRPSDDRLMALVAGIAMADPELSLRDIAAQLEHMRERTPRGGSKWNASSVKQQIDRARRAGLALPRSLQDRA